MKEFDHTRRALKRSPIDSVAALNVPVLDGLGINGDGAHAAHEHILINDIGRRGALLAGLVATL